MMGFFRGKDLNTGEWVRGYWSNGPDSSAPNSLVDIINVPTYDLPNNCLCMNPHRIVPQTLGQYTGLFDCNEITYTIVGNIYDNPDKLTIASE